MKVKLILVLITLSSLHLARANTISEENITFRSSLPKFISTFHIEATSQKVHFLTPDETQFHKKIVIPTFGLSIGRQISLFNGPIALMPHFLGKFSTYNTERKEKIFLNNGQYQLIDSKQTLSQFSGELALELNGSWENSTRIFQVYLLGGYGKNFALSQNIMASSKSSGETQNFEMNNKKKFDSTRIALGFRIIRPYRKIFSDFGLSYQKFIMTKNLTEGKEKFTEKPDISLDSKSGLSSLDPVLGLIIGFGLLF